MQSRLDRTTDRLVTDCGLDRSKIDGGIVKKLGKCQVGNRACQTYQSYQQAELNKKLIKPDLNEADTSKKLGSGTYGTVYRMKDNDFAIKTFKFSDATVSKNVVELACLRSLVGLPNLLSLIDIKIPKPDSFEYGAIVRYYPYTLNKLTNLKPYHVANITFKILTGVGYLHNLNLIHADLKPQNILCNIDTGDILIADFGLCKVNLPDLHLKVSDRLFGKPSAEVQSLWFRAPEVFLEMNYWSAIDLWSVGIIIYGLLIGKQLGNELHVDYKSDEISTKEQFDLFAKYFGRRQVQHQISTAFADLINCKDDLPSSVTDLCNREQAESLRREYCTKVSISAVEPDQTQPVIVPPPKSVSKVVTPAVVSTSIGNYVLSGKCSAVTQKGNQCRNPAKYQHLNAGYCGVHYNYASSSSKNTLTTSSQTNTQTQTPVSDDPHKIYQTYLSKFSGLCQSADTTENELWEEIRKRYIYYLLRDQSSAGKQAKINFNASASIQSDISDPIAYQLVTGLLQFDPTKRLTAYQALKHKYFADHKLISKVPDDSPLDRIRNLEFDCQANDGIGRLCIDNQQNIKEVMFPVLFDWLLLVCIKYRLTVKTIFVCLNLLTRTICSLQIDKQDLQLAGCVCLHLATVFTEQSDITMGDLLYISSRAYTPTQYKTYFNKILLELDLLIYTATEFDYLLEFFRQHQTPALTMVSGLKTLLKAGFVLENRVFTNEEIAEIVYNIAENKPDPRTADFYYPNRPKQELGFTEMCRVIDKLF